ncbi:MAG: 16S rRNA (cytosine(967)-C(5))-methyltransferase RsmB [Lysobacteraceae bacterium]|nr:MAG: 16S rRNA (cytosine(967)-C(5))-methyltransferase RsmB [Xanthomonadaceae bacterium]
MSAAAGAGVRAAAARTLDAVLHHGRSLKAELAVRLPALGDPRDRALLEAIVFAALRAHARYAQALAQWMPKPPGRRDGELRALLYAGFAQVDALRLPPHAAVAATVDAARELGRAHQKGLVNALLRRALRDGVPPGDPLQDWPAWLLGALREDWPDRLDAIVAASAQPAPMWLRANRRLSRPSIMRETLQAAGIAAATFDACPDALRLDTAVPVAMLPGFEDGLLSVQDGSAQLVADALAPAGGASVLDACAAPGGKAAHLLERDPALRLLALDVDARRLERVHEILQRVGVGAQAKLRAADALLPATWWDGTPFDAILLDAPCSATGVVRRHPDILLHRRASDLAALVDVQARLLDALWPALARGGVLLYATCSILRRENDAQVAAFLARTPGARLQPLDARFGHDTGHGSQRFPGEDGMDGFFYARLVKS